MIPRTFVILYSTIMAIMAPVHWAWSAEPDPRTADMFVSADTDAFDAGPPIGSAMPRIRALYEGEELTDIKRFVGARGTLLFANRSVEW